MNSQNPAILVLEDGKNFTGFSLGTEGETIGEVCFNTGMSGYQEILTDPSYCRQIVTMTAPHIGNYGTNKEDIESKKIFLSGFVIKEEATTPSNWRSEKSLGNYLKENSIIGIKGVDTRALTCHIRDNGAMNGIISTLDKDLDSLISKCNSSPKMSGLDLTKEVTCKNVFQWLDNTKGKYKVAAIDFGIKNNILRILSEHDCSIRIFPANVSAKTIIDFAPDGIFLSNGPGDPSAVTYAIRTVKNLLGFRPIFGICLGHQILTLALGGKTYKLKFGHRGLNHPVKNLITNRVEITSQNHGFAVDLETLPNNVEQTHVNLNDNTSAGIICKDVPAFSVQFHPESSPGPHDSRYLFEQFIKMMQSAKKS